MLRQCPRSDLRIRSTHFRGLNGSIRQSCSCRSRIFKVSFRLLEAHEHHPAVAEAVRLVAHAGVGHELLDLNVEREPVMGDGAALPQ